MESKLSAIFNQICKENSQFFEYWEISETRNGYYMKIKPLDAVEVCCGGKKTSAYENYLNIESLVNYAKRFAIINTA